MMKLRGTFLTIAAVAAGAVLAIATADTAHAAKSCGFGWAKPGKYRVSGNFRGKVEATAARLTNDCRVSLQIPGVFSGGRVKKSGKCLRFAIKVEGERRALFAKWCNSYGLVPWKGRTIRASIKRLSVEAPATKVKSNFNN
jgi:hypothetical protein